MLNQLFKIVLTNHLFEITILRMNDPTLLPLVFETL